MTAIFLFWERILTENTYQYWTISTNDSTRLQQLQSQSINAVYSTLCTSIQGSSPHTLTAIIQPTIARSCQYLRAMDSRFKAWGDDEFRELFAFASEALSGLVWTWQRRVLFVSLFSVWGRGESVELSLVCSDSCRLSIHPPIQPSLVLIKRTSVDISVMTGFVMVEDPPEMALCDGRMERGKDAEEEG